MSSDQLANTDHKQYKCKLFRFPFYESTLADFYSARTVFGSTKNALREKYRISRFYSRGEWESEMREFKFKHRLMRILES